ncbi:MAG: PIG-L family deacetylase [Actinomycetia bacterium]|nr:PIG-L family deacetylase [Actinomycetes bacterium]MCP4962424.1 PIG-L family deacetylase [Actinomycetes bacterium]
MDHPVYPLPENWQRAIAVVAHPDDLEYGAAAAIARWTDQGKDVRYVLATRGEAGIDSIPPEQAAPLRTREQQDSAAVVGVSTVEFLDHADGLLVNGIELRRDLAAAIRRHRPDVIIASNYRLRWGDTGPWNHIDHRELGAALPDAVRDAANRWLFADAGEPWAGVQWIAFGSSTAPTHAVDVTGSFQKGVESLECHRTYLEALGDPDFDPESFLRGAAASAGPLLGVELAVTFELVPT